MVDPTNPSPDDPTRSRVILRHDLLRRLRRVAALRSILAMLSWVVIAILLSAIATLAGITPNNGVLFAAAFFGVALLISWVLTQVLCKPLVRCPCCDASLWQCGTGNFKPRRMRIRPDATACPNCGAKII